MLVGRNVELAALDAGLAQLATGRGAVYLASGEPGIGKTRLANELAARAEARGIRVAWGACWEAGGAPAFWPWLEALGVLGLRFEYGGPVATGDPAAARFSLFQEVARSLTSAAAAQPIVIVLEDLHAADPSTLHLLEFLATQLRTAPILVLGTFRDLEAGLRADVRDVIARVSRAANVLALARLRPADVAAVVRELVEDADEKLIAHVFDTTHGNPLFVAEIVRQVRAGSASATIPLGVREVIRQRLALVPPTARRTLDAAAVLGVELRAAELERLAPDARMEIDAAIAGGLLTQHGDRLRFAHALYREALYHDLSRSARQALHREAARVLTATGAPAAEIAHHLLESAPDAVPEAIEQAIVAADQAVAAWAFEDAIALLRRAKQAIPGEPAESLLHARMLIALGDVHLRSGDPKGRELCVEAARIAREQGDASLLARAGLAYGSVFVMGGVDPTMVSILEEALARLPDEDSGLRARTLARLIAARQPSPAAQRPHDVELAFAAVEMGRRVASRRELLEILQSACGTLYGAADPRRRIDVARQLVQLAEELGDAPRLVAGYVRLAMDHLELADMAGYERVANAYEPLAARFGAAGPWRVPLMRSMLALSRDDLAQSERWQAEAVTVEPENPRAQRARAYHRICFLRAAERHGELRAAISELRSLWMALPIGAVLVDARVASALMRIGADDEVRALMATLPAAAFDEEINAHSLAEALWSTLDVEHARRVLPMLQRLAHRWLAYWLDVEIIEQPVDAAIAHLHGILGEWDACERLFESAMRDVEQLGRRSVTARMLFEHGDLLVRCGHDVARARTLIANARAIAVELGLGELVALIDRRHTPATAIAAPAPHRRTFVMVREGEYFAVTTGTGTLRFKATRGMQFLAQLAERPGRDVHVLELVGANEGVDRGDAGEVLDPRAMSAYRARAEALRDAQELAEERGDAEGVERARSELDAIATELSRGSGLGGGPRRSESAVDRARSAVQRRIKDALDRITEQDADLGAWLRRVVRTGNYCSFQDGT